MERFILYGIPLSVLLFVWSMDQVGHGPERRASILAENQSYTYKVIGRDSIGYTNESSPEANGCIKTNYGTLCGDLSIVRNYKGTR